MYLIGVKMYSDREKSIIESFERRGILKVVNEYKSIRDKVAERIRLLKQLGIDVSNYEATLEMLKSEAVSKASLIRKGDRAFINGIGSVIVRLNNYLEELNRKYAELQAVRERLSKLEQLYKEGKISEKAYKKLKEEYTAKLKQVFAEEGEMRTIVRKGQASEKEEGMETRVMKR